jgi:inhibitor of KinA sporulation pathway (predicted exonuclease)
MTREPAAPERPLLIVDLEATCWERSEHRAENMETIEIGAVLVDPLRADEPAREFQRLVRPTLRPQLSRFCTQLTGIRQEEVDSAEPFAAVFASFVAWIGAPHAVRFASWGRYDRRQLELDCSRSRFAYPFGDEHLNLKHWAAARLGTRPSGLAQALQKCGFTFDGRPHRGLDDARNIWRVARFAAGADLRALARGEA